jgi:hypothetical protein
MSLWGKTDAVGSRPKWIDLTNYPANTQLVFVDLTEAQAASNRAKGIDGPGWWLHREYTDSDGQIRYKSELVVTLQETAANAGDAADDLFVPDVTTTIAISAQPTNQTTVAGAATFSVTAALTPPGTATYQWQSKVGTAGWANVVGATNTSLALTGRVLADSGTQYRVVVGGAGSKKVTSDAATLTFGT